MNALLFQLQRLNTFDSFAIIYLTTHLLGVFFTGRKKWFGQGVLFLSRAFWWGLIVDRGMWALLPVEAMITLLYAYNTIKWIRSR